MEYNRARLKRSVKLAMRNTVPRPMLVTLVFSIAVSAGAWLINTILGGLLTGGFGSVSDALLYNIQQGIGLEEAVYATMLELFRRGPGAMFGAVAGSMALSILAALWRSVMHVGYEGWCLSMVRGENPPMGRIFSALFQFGPVLLTRFLTGLFEALWALLLAAAALAALAAAVLLFDSMEALLVLAALAVYAALFLGLAWVFTRYALVDYVLLDRGLSGMAAIRENRRLLRGGMGKCLLLQLSFFGWFLLEGAIVLGAFLIGMFLFGGPVFIDYISAERFAASLLGFLAVVLAAVTAVSIFSLWLEPYVTGSLAAFYGWARGEADGLSGGPRFDAGSGSWGGPSDYTWTSGPASGTGTGNGPASGGDNGGPRPPRSPRDDPWN